MISFYKRLDIGPRYCGYYSLNAWKRYGWQSLVRIARVFSALFMERATFTNVLIVCFTEGFITAHAPAVIYTNTTFNFTWFMWIIAKPVWFRYLCIAKSTFCHTNHVKMWYKEFKIHVRNLWKIKKPPSLQSLVRITCITFRHGYTCFMPSNPCLKFSLTECNTTVYAEFIVHASVHLAPTRLVLVVCVTVGK